MSLTPTGIAAGVGFRSLTIFALNSDGYINATSPTTAYEGITVSAARNFDLNDPAPRVITHVADDAPFALSILPPLEALSGTIQMTKQHDTLDAALTGIKKYNVGEAALFNVSTNLKGFEVTVGALAYGQTQEVDTASANFGEPYWRFKIMPKAVLFPTESGFNDDAEQRTYTIVPKFVTKHIWGTAFATGTEGVTRSQLVRGVSQYKPKIVAWKANGSADDFSLPTAYPAADTAKMVAWVNGTLTEQSGSTTTTLTFAAAPADTAIVTLWYETA